MVWIGVNIILEILVSDKFFIRKLCKNKFDCLNEIGFPVKVISRMLILIFFLRGLILADERIPKTSRE